MLICRYLLCLITVNIVLTCLRRLRRLMISLMCSDKFDASVSLMLCLLCLMTVFDDCVW